jgi:pre-mRNA-splicing factor SYF1
MTNHLGRSVISCALPCLCVLLTIMTVAQNRPIDELSAYFPLTFPIPQPKSHPDLITTKDLQREEDLLRNPTSFRAWWSAIHSTRENFYALHKLNPDSNIPEYVVAILGPLASPLARLTLQRLTYLFEAALLQFPNSFKLWKAYLNMRMSFVLGKLVVKKKSGGKKKFPEMKDALEEGEEELEQWDTALDPIVGWEEWKSLIATFERALMWLPKVSRTVVRLYLSNFPFLSSFLEYGSCIFQFSSIQNALPFSHIRMRGVLLTAHYEPSLPLFISASGLHIFYGQREKVERLQSLSIDAISSLILA